MASQVCSIVRYDIAAFAEFQLQILQAFRVGAVSITLTSSMKVYVLRVSLMAM